jgi:hypothetical protein
MARGRKLARAGFTSLLIGLLGCGQDAPGDIRTFAQYRVFVDATDQPDLNTGRPQRQLMFTFNGINDTSPARCASFGDATATFSGQPVTIPDPGGWVTNNIPTNTSPGQTVNGDHCYDPFIQIFFNNPQGEPQDGTLDIDGAGTHLEVPFNHPFGSPSLILVSAASNQIILSLQNFLFMPTVADVVVILTDPVNPNSRIAIQQTTLSADGMLELSLPAGAITRPVGANLLVVVNLGDEVIQCLGFKSCSATSNFTRGMEVDIPFP